MSLFTGGMALAAGLGAGGLSLFGASKQASAQERAAELQAQTTQEGLDFLKAQKAKQEAAAQPYLNLGGMAVGQLPGMAARSPMGGPPAPYGTQPMVARPMAAAPLNALATAPPAAPQGAMVTLRAPDGSTRQFAPNDPMIQIALQRGALRT